MTTEYVHLIGAEEATRAGNRIAAAADQISSSSSYFSEQYDRFLARLDERVVLLQELVERIEAAAKPAAS